MWEVASWVPTARVSTWRQSTTRFAARIRTSASKWVVDFDTSKFKLWNNGHCGGTVKISFLETRGKRSNDDWLKGGDTWTARHGSGDRCAFTSLGDIK